jgi:hypothetical protein
MRRFRTVTYASRLWCVRDLPDCHLEMDGWCPRRPGRCARSTGFDRAVFWTARLFPRLSLKRGRRENSGSRGSFSRTNGTSIPLPASSPRSRCPRSMLAMPLRRAIGARRASATARCALAPCVPCSPARCPMSKCRSPRSLEVTHGRAADRHVVGPPIQPHELLARRSIGSRRAYVLRCRQLGHRRGVGLFQPPEAACTARAGVLEVVRQPPNPDPSQPL